MLSSCSDMDISTPSEHSLATPAPPYSDATVPMTSPYPLNHTPTPPPPPLTYVIIGENFRQCFLDRGGNIVFSKDEHIFVKRCPPKNIDEMMMVLPYGYLPLRDLARDGWTPIPIQMGVVYIDKLLSAEKVDSTRVVRIKQGADSSAIKKWLEGVQGHPAH